MNRATATDYERQLLALRPPGPAWAEDDALLAGMATGLARLHNRALDLIEEADPRTAYEMLDAWERAAGLPDVCPHTPSHYSNDDEQTLEERQRRLVQKLTSLGGQSRAYFIKLAEMLGYPGASITEFRPFICTSECDDGIDPDPWRHVWRLNVPQETAISGFTTGAACIEPLRTWGNARLECTIAQLEPAQTHVLFAYGDTHEGN